MQFLNDIILAVLGLNPIWFIFAFAAIFLDLVTGFLIKGVLAHNVRSCVMREGLVHKAWEIAIILCAALVDVAIMTGLDVGLQMASSATCTYILVMEVASVCENALDGNPELASAPIIRYIAQARDAAPIEAQNVTITTKIANGTADPDDTADLGRHMRGE